MGFNVSFQRNINRARPDIGFGDFESLFDFP